LSQRDNATIFLSVEVRLKQRIASLISMIVRDVKPDSGGLHVLGRLPGA